MKFLMEFSGVSLHFETHKIWCHSTTYWYILCCLFWSHWGLDQHLNYYKVTIASHLVRNGCPLFASNDVPWMIGWHVGRCWRLNLPCWIMGVIRVSSCWIIYSGDTLMTWDYFWGWGSSIRICLVKLDLDEASTNFLVLVQCWWQWLVLLDDDHPLQTLSQAGHVEVVTRLASLIHTDSCSKGVWEVCLHVKFGNIHVLAHSN